MSISLSLLSDEPIVVLNDGEEYSVVNDDNAMLLDEDDVYSAFGSSEEYDEYALEEINVEKLSRLMDIISTESISLTAASLLKCASPVDLKIPSMDHFRNPNVNKAVTSIVKESIASKVWDSIKKVFRTIAKFFMNLLTGKSSRDKKLKAMGEEIKSNMLKQAKEIRENANKNYKRSNRDFPGLKAEINTSILKRMDEYGGVSTPVFPLGSITDKDLMLESVYGYLDLFFLCNKPGETIKYENYLDSAKNFEDFIKRLNSHLGKLKGCIKVIEQCVKEVTSLVSNRSVEESELVKLKEEHDGRVSELNEYFKSFYEGFFNEGPMSNDKLQKFTPMMPGLVRWGAILDTDTDGPYKLIIRQRCYTDMTHIDPGECYISYPDLGIVLPILKKIEGSIEPISAGGGETSAFVKEASPFTLVPDIDKIDEGDKGVSSLCVKIFRDVIVLIGNLKSINGGLVASFDVMRSQFLTSLKSNVELRI